MITETVLRKPPSCTCPEPWRRMGPANVTIHHESLRWGCCAGVPQELRGADVDGADRRALGGLFAKSLQRLFAAPKETPT